MNESVNERVTCVTVHHICICIGLLQVVVMHFAKLDSRQAVHQTDSCWRIPDIRASFDDPQSFHPALPTRRHYLCGPFPLRCSGDFIKEIAGTVLDCILRPEVLRWRPPLRHIIRQGPRGTGKRGVQNGNISE